MYWTPPLLILCHILEVDMFNYFQTWGPVNKNGQMVHSLLVTCIICTKNFTRAWVFRGFTILSFSSSFMILSSSPYINGMGMKYWHNFLALTIRTKSFSQSFCIWSYLPWNLRSQSFKDIGFLHFHWPTRLW